LSQVDPFGLLLRRWCNFLSTVISKAIEIYLLLFHCYLQKLFSHNTNIHSPRLSHPIQHAENIYISIRIGNDFAKSQGVQFIRTNNALFRDKVRCIEYQAHKYSSEGASDGDGSNPREEEKTDSLKVDGFQGAVAETDTNSSACDAHRG